MKNILHYFNKDWKLSLLLFLCSFFIYFFYFPYLFLNINSVLSNVIEDNLKNYYTYVYHITNDESFLNFSGMNYPYGEHVVYTDCQPILTFILRLLPFTHNYLIGILHSLVFLSFMINPLVLFRIFKLLTGDKFFSFFIALALNLLSPQFNKIYMGHFALAYAFIIPVCILLLLLFFREGRKSSLVKLFIMNTALFLLHPYLGFSVSLFTFISLFIFALLQLRSSGALKRLSYSFLIGLSPLLIFKLFLFFTDHHVNRPEEPFGMDSWGLNLGGLCVPGFGPFNSFLNRFFEFNAFNFEGLCYLGFFTMALCVVFIFALPFMLRTLKLQKEVLVLFISAVFLLMLAFGFHNTLLEFIHIEVPGIKQFRATGRFGWFFYYMLPILIAPPLYHFIKTKVRPERSMYYVSIFALLYFCFNLWEANSYFQIGKDELWKHRNFFNEKFLNDNERNILKSIKAKKPQAIIPLPLFYSGSEMYERGGFYTSMLPSILLSYHGQLPIVGVFLSRTSVTETENGIELLNAYKKNKAAEKLLTQADFLVVKASGTTFFPDEMRLAKKVQMFQKNDSLEVGYVSKYNLLTEPLSKPVFTLNKKNQEADANNIVFMQKENRKPFINTNMNDYTTLFKLDSTKLSSGRYVVSFHHHYTKKNYKAVGLNLIVVKITGSTVDWQYNQNVRVFSGFYPGYAVFEYQLELVKNSSYEFLLKGFYDVNYTISDFMLRPENTTVIQPNGKDSTYNNFPN